MTNAEAIELIKHYTKNVATVDPQATPEAINLTVAGVLTKYLAAAVDPGKYAYYPHPYNAAETVLHNAAEYLFKQMEVA